MRYRYNLSFHGYVAFTLETDQPLHVTTFEAVTDEIRLVLEPGAKVSLWPKPKMQLIERSEVDDPEVPKP